MSPTNAATRTANTDNGTGEAQQQNNMQSKFAASRQVEIISAAFNGGQPKSGVELGPQ